VLQECCNKQKAAIVLGLPDPEEKRHHNPSKSQELLAQQHSITILQTGIYSIQDSCWTRILRSHVWDVTLCSVTGADV